MNLMFVIPLLLLAQEVQSPTVEELVRTLGRGGEEGSAARQELLKKGPDQLPALVEAGLGPARSPALTDLIFELKKVSASGDVLKEALLRKLDARVSFQIREVDLRDALFALGRTVGINVLLDPGWPQGPPHKITLTLNNRDTSFRKALDLIAFNAQADYDVRYGVIFMAKPDRLWCPPGRRAPVTPLSKDAESVARDHVRALGAQTPGDRDLASAELRKMGPATLPVLEEGARSGDPEMAGRCADLIRALRPSRYGSLREGNAWRRQDLDNDGKDLANNLNDHRLDAPSTGQRLQHIVDYLENFTSFTLSLQVKDPMMPVSLDVRDVAMGNLLELLTLPYGLDARIEGKRVVIFDPAR